MSQNFSGTRNIILFSITAGILLIFIYLSSSSYNTRQETIHIGINLWPGNEHFFVAKKQGFFEQVGLDIELIELSTLSEVRRAFERGKVDGMTATLVEVLEAYKYSGKIAQPILITDYSNGADEILGARHIKTIKELKGKKIGVVASGISKYLVTRALNLNDMDESDVEILPMELYELEKAFTAGKVDAITSYPPSSVLMKKSLDVNVLFDSSLIPQEILDVVAIEREFLSKNKKIIEQFKLAWELTLDYVSTNPEDAYETLTERFPISINEFKKTMEAIQLVKLHEQSQYFEPGGILQSNFVEAGEVVFKNSNQDVDYTQFMHSYIAP